MMKSALSIKTIDNIHELSKVLDSLSVLETPSMMIAPSLRKYWVLSFFQTYGASRHLAITVVYEDGIPQLILPLQIRENSTLEFLCDETSDFNDFIYGKVEVELIKYALKYWISRGIRSIRLDHLPPNSKTIELLCTISKELEWEIKVESCDSLPVVIPELDKEIQNWTGVSKHAIMRYKQKQRALSKIANVSFSFIETESQLQYLFPTIQQLHITRWKLNNINSKYLDPRRVSFIVDVCREAMKENALFFPIMKIDDALASYIIGFRYGDTIFDWNTSFSVDFFKWSPGALLLLYVLSNFQEFNYSKYNLMKGLEKYKFIWTNIVEYNLSLTIENLQ